MFKTFTNKLFLQTIVIIIPISVLISDYVASKLETFGQSPFATHMTIFLFLYALYISYKNRKYLNCRETRYVLLFFLLSIPAYFMSVFTSLESYIRFFALISYVPLGFMCGLSWGRQFNVVEDKIKDSTVFLLMIPATLASYMIASSTFVSLYNENEDYSRDYVFGIVLFLPLLLYFKKRFWPIIFMIIASCICVISAKRTGIVCVAVIVFFFIAIKVGAKRIKYSKVITTLFLSLLVMFLAYRATPDISPQMEIAVERFENLNDESNEARWGKYERISSEIGQANFFTLLFGHGCLASIQKLGSPTHNDLLEITYDYGFLPLTCIIFLFFSLLFRVFRGKKIDLYSSLVLLSTLIILFLTTMGNCMFTNHIFVFVLLFTLGFALSNLRAHGSNKVYCQDILSIIYGQIFQNSNQKVV